MAKREEEEKKEKVVRKRRRMKKRKKNSYTGERKKSGRGSCLVSQTSQLQFERAHLKRAC